MSMILCLCFDKTHSFGDIAGSVKILGCVLFVSEMSALLLFCGFVREARVKLLNFYRQHFQNQPKEFKCTKYRNSIDLSNYP